MPYIDAAVQAAATFAQKWREAAGPADNDMLSWVEIHREEQPHVAFVYEQRPKSEGLAEWLTTNAQPEIVISITDVYAVLTPQNPVTGKPWQAGEAHDVRVNHRGLENGWIGDAMIVVAAGHDGETRSQVLNYTRGPEGITWVSLSDTMDAVLAKMYVSGAEDLAEILGRIAVAYDTPANKATTQAGLDLVAFDSGQKRGAISGATFFAKPGSPRHQALRKALSAKAIADPAAWMTGNRGLMLSK